MRKLSFAAVAAFVLGAAPALAADLGAPYRGPAPAAYVAYNWSGLYVGAFAGGAWQGGNVTAAETGSTGGVFPVGTAYNNFAPFNYGLSNSFIGGATVGWNYQSPGSIFVFGLEGEAGYMRLRGSAGQPGTVDTFSTTTVGDWYGILAGRVGLAWDRFLVYGKGGAAFVEARSRVNDSCVVAPCGAGTLAARGSSDLVHWTAGGGVEYAFSQNWTVKAEYMYIDLSQTYSVCGAGGAAATGSTFCYNHTVRGLHTAKVGLNYKFDWGGPVVARY